MMAKGIMAGAGKAGGAERAASGGAKSPAVLPPSKGIAATGRHGGVIGKTAAGKMGHSTAPVTSVASDRGAFKVRG